MELYLMKKGTRLQEYSGVMNWSAIKTDALIDLEASDGERAVWLQHSSRCTTSLLKDTISMSNLLMQC